MVQENKTALSKTRTLVQVAWIGLILMSTYLVIGVPVGLLNPRLIMPWLGVCFWGPGLVIGLPWESLTLAQWRAYLLPVGLWGVVGTASVLYAVDQIRRIVLQPGSASPFTAENAGRIRKAGLAVLCSAGAKVLRDISFGHFIALNVTIPGAQVSYRSDMGLSTLFLGLMILAVAEVMRHGVKLQEDQDLTV